MARIQYNTLPETQAQIMPLCCLYTKQAYRMEWTARHGWCGSKSIRTQIQVKKTMSSEIPASVRPTDAYLTSICRMRTCPYSYSIRPAIGSTEGNSPKRPRSLYDERLAALSRLARGRPINSRLVDSAAVYHYNARAAKTR